VLIEAIVHARSPAWRQLSALYRQVALGGGNLTLLLAALLLDLTKVYVVSRDPVASMPLFWNHHLFLALFAVDLSAFAIIAIMAAVLRSPATRSRNEELHLAGLSPAMTLSPLFDLVFGMFVLTATAQALVFAAISYEPPAVRTLSLLTQYLLILGGAWFSTSLLTVLNEAKIHLLWQVGIYAVWNYLILLIAWALTALAERVMSDWLLARGTTWYVRFFTQWDGHAMAPQLVQVWYPFYAANLILAVLLACGGFGLGRVAVRYAHRLVGSVPPGLNKHS
jgi:hypothetical protein